MTGDAAGPRGRRAQARPPPQPPTPQPPTPHVPTLPFHREASGARSKWAPYIALLPRDSADSKPAMLEALCAQAVRRDDVRVGGLLDGHAYVSGHAGAGPPQRQRQQELLGGGGGLAPPTKYP